MTTILYRDIPMTEVRRGHTDWTGSLIIHPPVIDDPDTNRWKYWALTDEGSKMVQYVSGDTLTLQVRQKSIPMDEVHRGNIDWIGNLIVSPPVIDNPSTKRWKYWISTDKDDRMVQYVNGDTLTIQIF